MIPGDIYTSSPIERWVSPARALVNDTLRTVAALTVRLMVGLIMYFVDNMPGYNDDQRFASFELVLHAFALVVCVVSLIDVLLDTCP